MVRDGPGEDEVAAVIARYAPKSLGADVAHFARVVTTAASPQGPARAKALLFAAGKLGSFGAKVGLVLAPEALLSPSVIERFILTDGAALSAPTRRTVRSNLRSLAVALDSRPAPARLARERAKPPYDALEVAAYLALARAQPTPARRQRALGLLCLGAGAGLMGADLRGVRGTDVHRRSGGVMVEVGGPRPRVVPVLARYHEDLCASAAFAGGGYVIGGRSPTRRTVTTPLVSSLAGGVDLAPLDTGRLRSTWLASCAEAIGLKAFLDAAGVTCTQRLGDIVAGLEHPGEAAAVALLDRRR